ncbi:MAG: EscU/YscU/HrcU family type III secretion system export apparatus switch protein [Spirochaetes bacterium]|nr:EscU/YscU/HrcU family type III secretion system export apparatus switch protein [Spirochaetota bacterium]
MFENSNKKAIALKYQDKDIAPEISAKGKGKLAEKIINLAVENGIYIKEDPEIADILYCLDIGQYVPEQLYNVIAGILVTIYNIDNK